MMSGRYPIMVLKEISDPLSKSVETSGIDGKKAEVDESDSFIIEQKKQKNRLAAKKSREKKAAIFKELQEKSRSFDYTLNYMQELIGEYDMLVTNLVYFITHLVTDDLLSENRIFSLHEFLSKIQERGFTKMTGYLNVKNITAGDAVGDLLIMLEQKMGICEEEEEFEDEELNSE